MVDSLTVKTRGVPYWCAGFRSVNIPPSPNDQFRRVPPTIVEASLNVTVRSASPDVGKPKNPAAGTPDPPGVTAGSQVGFPDNETPGAALTGLMMRPITDTIIVMMATAR
jgi:hypothetical protein